MLLSVYSYLFWVGFGTLGGAFFKLGSTAFLGSFMAPFNLSTLVDTEAVETSNFLDWLLSFGRLSWLWHNEGHMRISIRIKAKKAAKVLQLVFIRLAEVKVRTCNTDGQKWKRLRGEVLYMDYGVWKNTSPSRGLWKPLALNMLTTNSSNVEFLYF